MDKPKLIEDSNGMVFEYLDENEAEFFYEEIIVRRSYLQHGVALGNDAIVIDAGANVGLFSLQCLREARAVKVYAFEPIPITYEILLRNLRNAYDRADRVARHKPVALRVGLGGEQDEAEFTFYGDCPGESTRNPLEREQQQAVLRTDTGAAHVRQALQASADTSDTARGEVVLSRGGITPLASVTHRGPGERRGMSSHPEMRESTRLIAHGAKTCAPKGAAASSACQDEREGPAESSELRDSSPGPGRDADAAGRDRHSSPHEGAANHGQHFVCSVVPLSLALRELQLDLVDLLKVDVEGDEFAVLEGIDDDDWSMIRQVSLEVHDIDGRLRAILDLLRSEPAAFDEVCWEPQRTSEVHGYIMVVPEALNMFYVFAKRRSTQPPTTAEAGLIRGIDRCDGGGSARKMGHRSRGALPSELPLAACSCRSSSLTPYK